MHGISPRSSMMTPLQMQTSRQVSEAVPELPTSISDLISEYAVTDFSLATQTLELDKDGEVIQSPENLKIVSNIELALTSPSFVCDPAIKAAIIFNGVEYVTRTGGNLLRPYLAEIINGFKTNGMRLILDDVFLSDLDMTFVDMVDLSGMSARRAIFKNLIMDGLNMDGADLTGAQFLGSSLERVSLNQANIVDAVFSNVFFRNTEVSELTGNQPAIFRHSIVPEIIRMYPHSVRNLKTMISGSDISATPGSEIFTLPPHQIIYSEPENN